MTDSTQPNSQQAIIDDLALLHQQLRLYRLAKQLGVSGEMLERLKPTAPSQSQALMPKGRTTDHLADKPAARKGRLTEDQDQGQDQVRAQESKELLPLRQQVEQLALAKGVADKEAQLAEFSSWLDSHYHELDSFIRDRLINCYTPRTLPAFVAQVAVSERSSLEHLSWYLHLKQLSEQGDEAEDYALKHQPQLLDILVKEVSWFQTDSDRIALDWAQGMLAKGWQKQGFAALAVVPSTREGRANPYYHEAVMLAAKYRDEQSTAELSARLRNQYDPKLKRQQLSFWLSKAHPSNQQPSAKALWLRGSLQPIFADLFSTFEQHPTSLGQLAELLIGQRDTLTVMPYLWDTLKTAAGQFRSPSLTHALWRGFCRLEAKADDHPTIRGVVAAAKLQMFLLDTHRDEVGLWWAKAQLEQYDVTKAMGHSWSGLASGWLASLDTPQRRTIEGRDYLKAFVRLTLGAPIGSVQFHHYLKLAKNPAQLSLLEVLKRRSAQPSTSKDDVAIAAYGRLILVRSLTNNELADWLRLAEHQHLDLGWRICSVLRFRRSLSPGYAQAWQYCGENQNPPPIGKVAALELEGFFPYHDLAQTLLTHIVAAGPLLTSIFGSKAPDQNSLGSTVQHPLALRQLAISAEEQIFDEKIVGALLDQLPQIVKKGNRSDKRGQPFSPPTVVADAELAIEGRTWGRTELGSRARQWLIAYFRVCQFYGFARLGFDLTHLHQLEELLVASTCFDQGMTDRAAARARMTQIEAAGGSSADAKKLVKAFFKLEPQQKQALRGLLHLAGSFPGPAGQIWGQRMMILLTFVHFPSHFYGLKVLEEINCPLGTIRWAESMLLTSGYSALRRQQGVSSPIPFPQSLRNQPKISAAGPLPR